MTNPLFKRDGATGKVHYYYNSHLGQPLKLFDKAGKITWAARSQAFGQTTVFVNETENNLRFPGQYEDGETGLSYNHYRYYDQTTGRYLRTDPLGLGAGINSYVYVSSDPLNTIDYNGLCGTDDEESLRECRARIKSDLGLLGSLIDLTSLGGLADDLMSYTALGYVSSEAYSELVDERQISVNSSEYKPGQRGPMDIERPNTQTIKSMRIQKGLRLFGRLNLAATLLGTAADGLIVAMCLSE